MSDEPNKTERKLSRSGEKQTLRGVVGDDVEDLDVFGYEVIYTTGEFTVDRGDLLEKAEAVGLPEWMLPGKTMWHNAFGYAVDDLLDGREEVMHPVDDAPVDAQRVRFVLDKNDSRYSWSLDARVFYPPEMAENDDGNWVQHELGVIKYDNDVEAGENRVRFVDRCEPSDALGVYWHAESEEDPLNGGLKQRMEALYAKHREAHRGKDVGNMVYYLVNQWTDSIKLRDACYFVPANHTYHVDGEERPISDLVDAFSELYEWLNENAEKPTYAQQTHLDIIEIMDTDRQRKMVERKVQNRLEDMAEDMASSVIEQAQEDGITDEVADDVTEEMSEILAVAGEYEGLLENTKTKMKTEKAVKRAVGSALSGMGDDESELVEAVLDEVDAPTPDDEAVAAA